MWKIVMLPAPSLAPGEPMTPVLPERAVEAPKLSDGVGGGFGWISVWVTGVACGAAGGSAAGACVVEVVPWSVPSDSSAALAVLSSTSEQKIVRKRSVRPRARPPGSRPMSIPAFS